MAEIIKVYSTEEYALTENATYDIGSASVNGDGGTIHNVESAVPYYTYNKYYYRIESNEPVSEFQIDWDDGENNSPEKRNIQIIKNEQPVFSTVVEHVYTEAPTSGGFFPLVRTRNIEGYVSKWYTNDSSNNTFTELESNTITGGQNEFSKVSREKAGSDRIPHFVPAKNPPVAILKTDRNQVFSGIDNNVIERFTATSNYPLLYAYTDSSESLGTDALVKLTVMTTDGGTTSSSSGHVREFILHGDDILTGDADLNDATTSGVASELATKAVPFGNYNSSETAAKETVVIKFVTDSGAGGGEADGDKTDLTGDYLYIWDAGMPYLIWFDISGSDTQPTVIPPGGFGGFAGTFKVDLSSGAGDCDTNTEFATVMRGQIYDDATFGAHFAITVSGPAMVQFVSTEFGNQPDPYVSDSAHIKDPGGTTTYTTVQGVPKVILTECANKLLKAELINVNKITDTERIYIKVFDADISDLDQFPATATNLSAAIVSNGNPIVDITESIYNAVLDGSESYTRESNIGIGNYYFTTGRTETLQGPFPLQSQNTDTYGVSDSLGSTATTVPQLSVSYTNNNIRHLLDANSRFLDYSMLCRLQVADNHTKITGSGDVSNKRSWIEHYNDDQYVSTVNSGVLKAPTSLQSRAMIAVSNSDTPKVAHWYDVDVEKYLNTSSYILLGGNTDWESSGDSSIKGTADTADPRSMTNVPKNFIFIAKSDLFDKLYLDLKNTYTPSASPIDIDITAYYSHADGWKPLNITDETQRLQTNGLITWDIPNDWASTTASGVESGNWSGPIKANSVPARSGHDPGALWDFSAYGVIIAIQAKAGATAVAIRHILPCNNTHSQIIKVVDPHHVSLNSIAIAQSISYNRQSNFVDMKDRFGRSEIRKIGANGGEVTFGSIDFGDTDSQGNRKKVKNYQKQSIPVYLDVTHQSGELTRIFGVITSMSEDFPTGKQFPKYGIKMKISHIIELDSSYNLLSGKLAIGGEIDGTRKYISSA